MVLLECRNPAGYAVRVTNYINHTIERVRVWFNVLFLIHPIVNILTSLLGVIRRHLVG